MQLGLELSKLGFASAVLAAAPQVAQAAPTAITGVQLNSSNGGVTVQLQVANSVQLETLKTRYGQTLAIDVINTQLQLAQGESFSHQNPAAGIASVEVVQQYANTVRVVLEGTNTVPEAEVSSGPQGLSVAASTQQVTAQMPEQEAESQAEGEPLPEAKRAPKAEQPQQKQEPIELIVTPTRTEEQETDVPRSVTVITREEIEEQTAFTRNMSDILGKLVPGLAPGNQSLSEFGQQLRGREPLVLIDGVPQKTNRDASRNLRIVDPSIVKRIEVVRGPTAIFGQGATGGVINIITKSGGEGNINFNATLESTGSLSRLSSDSLGGTTLLGFSGQAGDLSYRFQGAFERVGSLFDAEGDRIPPDLLSTQGSIADTNNFDLFGKLDWELGDNKLQLTVNHFSTDQNTDFVTDPTVNNLPPKETKARARSGLELDKQSAIRNTFINLNYTNPDLFFNSSIDAKLFYRDYFTRFFPFDGKRFGFVTPQGFRIFQSQIESEEFGLNIEAETPLIEDDLTLLTGVDFSDEDTVQPVRIFDPEAFDKSNGLRFEQIEKRPWTPPFNQNNLGLFARLKWQPSSNFLIRGGLRYERIGINVDTFTTLDGNRIPGGELDYSDLLFSIGTSYDITDRVNLFASFAQGFSAADVGLTLRGADAGFSVESLDPEPKKVDNYEIGIRGNWEDVQFEVSGFFSWSELGSTFDRETFEIVRAPERTYGIEASIDAQVSEDWQIGSSFSFTEGENDPDNDGDFTPLDGFRIPPLKLTAYVENETAPGWQNRLQMLYIGSRDRAFEEGIDPFPVSSYVTFDLVSSLDLGNGTLQLGIQNLLNNQHFTAPSQLLRLGTNDTFTPASGTTFRLQYSVDF